MKLYIAGPMTGKVLHNFPAFDAARDKLVAMGYTVISPADLTRETLGMSADWMPTDEAIEAFKLVGAVGYLQFLPKDLEWVARVEGLVLLDGWEGSTGGRVEVHLGQLYGKQFFDTDMRRITPPRVETLISGAVTSYWAAA